MGVRQDTTKLRTDVAFHRSEVQFLQVRFKLFFTVFHINTLKHLNCISYKHIWKMKSKVRTLWEWKLYWPHRTPGIGVWCAQHGAGHSRYDCPGKSRWGPLAARCMSHTGSTGGASRSRGQRGTQTLLYHPHISAFHTGGWRERAKNAHSKKKRQMSNQVYQHAESLSVVIHDLGERPLKAGGFRISVSQINVLYTELLQ